MRYANSTELSKHIWNLYIYIYIKISDDFVPYVPECFKF